MVSLLQTLWFVVVRFIARSEITELNTEISLIQTNHSVSNPCKFPKKLGSDDGLSTNVAPLGLGFSMPRNSTEMPHLRC